jgi:O-antigen/teichoic acid export membrane protein
LHNLLWDNLHSVITRVVFVDFADLTRRGIPLRNRYLQIVEIITASLWPAFGGVAILSSPLIYIIYGPQWTQASLPLSFLCIAAMLLISITMTWELFVVSNETGRQARFEFIRTDVGLGLFIAGCFHSLAAAAAARVGEALFAQFLYRPHIERMTQTSMKDFAPIYLRSALLTLAATLPATLLMIRFGWSPRTPLIYVGLAIISGLLLWIAILRILRHPLYEQMTLIVAGTRLRSKGSEAANI